ncbi:hypothetical protein PRZ48_001630 [Zasmidium cellare]|uniref:mRNA export factor GLE1 n=1 Tax=Zasmidium cellare TaxID=395010 RepID=A0ABR0F3B2_ZASCE|nr:hypothetical protein PRZ48_001630 [Zasmidium cellare]
MSRLHVDTEKAYQKLLDERACEQKQRHLEGLDRALEKHEQVQKSARLCVERIQLEQQQIRLRQEQEERRKLEEEKRKVEEARRKIAEEEQARQEAERKREEERQAALKRQQEEEAARKAAEQKKKEADEARQKAESEKAAAEKAAKDKAAAEQAQQAQQSHAQQPQQPQQPQPPQPPQQSSTALVPAANGTQTELTRTSLSSNVDERQKVHDEYLAIHQRLKELRKSVREVMKTNQQFRKSVEAAEGQVKKNIGQINRVNKKGNKEKIQNVMSQIDQSLAIPETTDISKFMYNPTPVQPIEGPLILIYMLHIFCKFVIRQIDAEVGSLSTEKGDAADALGIAVALVFSNPKYQVEGRPLTDIMWASYHHNCPRLFGVPLRKLPKNVKNFGALAAGFAAMTLRQFPTGRINPAPNRIFWETLARIVNLPLQEIKKDHLTMLEWMLQPTFVSKFIQIYGGAGLVATRHIIMDFAPAMKNNPKTRVEATGVHDLRLVLDSELNLPL